MVPATAPATDSGTRTAAAATCRVPQLDGLRAVAILLVLAWHYFVRRGNFESGSALDWVQRGLGLSWSGVDLFFVLSGYLIGGILLDNAHSANYYSTFYIRRSCRILPIYFLFILPVLIVPLFEPPAQIANIAATLSQPFSPWLYPLFLQNFGMAWANQLPSYSGVTWSLAIEEQFYLILPLLLHRIGRTKVPLICAAGVIVALASRVLLITLLPSHGILSSYVLLPTRCDSLLIGVLCAWAARDSSTVRWLQEHQSKLRALCFVGALTFLIVGFMQPYGTVTMSTVGFTLLAVFYGLVLLVATTQPAGILGRLLSIRLLVPIATVSYAVYLIHIPVENALHQFVFHRKPQLATWADAGVQAGALATTFLIAAGSWFLLEKRLIRFGHRYRF